MIKLSYPRNEPIQDGQMRMHLFALTRIDGNIHVWKGGVCQFPSFLKLNFSTSQAQAQEKAKIKTSKGLVFQILELTLPKTKAKNLQKVPKRRHQNFGSELYRFRRVMEII